MLVTTKGDFPIAAHWMEKEAEARSATLSVDRFLATPGAPGFDAARDAERADEAGEDLRLLYVAATRAISRLVLWWAPTWNTRSSPLHRLLADDGTLYLHLDYREAHYVKVALDGLFGRACFLNELIWAYDYGGRTKKRWPTKHDTILVYGPREVYDPLPEYGLSAATLGRCHYVGYVGRAATPEETSDPPFPPGYVLVTAGGGGDGLYLMENYLKGLKEREPSYESVVVTGPVMDDASRKRVEWLSRGLRARVLDFGSAAAPSLDLGLGYRRYRTVSRALAQFDAWLGRHLDNLRRLWCMTAAAPLAAHVTLHFAARALPASADTSGNFAGASFRPTWNAAGMVLAAALALQLLAHYAPARVQGALGAAGRAARAAEGAWVVLAFAAVAQLMAATGVRRVLDPLHMGVAAALGFAVFVRVAPEEGSEKWWY